LFGRKAMEDAWFPAGDRTLSFMRVEDWRLKIYDINRDVFLTRKVAFGDSIDGALWEQPLFTDPPRIKPRGPFSGARSTLWGRLRYSL
jgi:hypothetical protein